MEMKYSKLNNCKQKEKELNLNLKGRVNSIQIPVKAKISKILMIN